MMPLFHTSCRIISALVEEARRQKCYKVILDCAEHNVEFYAKSGFERKEVQMVRTVVSGMRLLMS